MKAIQMTIDESLLERIDRVARELGTTRSAFARDALREALKRLEASRLEEQHRRGYEKHPVRSGEFDDWESEQVWGD